LKSNIDVNSFSIIIIKQPDCSNQKENEIPVATWIIILIIVVVSIVVLALIFLILVLIIPSLKKFIFPFKVERAIQKTKIRANLN